MPKFVFLRLEMGNDFHVYIVEKIRSTLHTYKKLLYLAFLVIPCMTMGQSDADDSLDLDEKWVKGYIVLKDQSDSIHGFLRLYQTDLGYVERLKFRDKDGKVWRFGSQRINYKYKDELKYFGSEGQRYRFMNWADKNLKDDLLLGEKRITDWVKLEEAGAITLSLGFYLVPSVSSVPGSVQSRIMPVPVWCLKKGSEQTAFIFGKLPAFAKYDLMHYVLNKNNKKYFLSFISDDKELISEIGDKELLFLEVLSYVKRYNQHPEKK